MTHEIMQKLKNAGFLLHPLLENSNLFVQPTLSELIEACGEYFVSLTQYESGWFRAEGNYPLYDEGTNWSDAHSPEEAVAKLWLTLNKK